jgi:hypothetical protein
MSRSWITVLEGGMAYISKFLVSGRTNKFRVNLLAGLFTEDPSDHQINKNKLKTMAMAPIMDYLLYIYSIYVMPVPFKIV